MRHYIRSFAWIMLLAISVGCQPQTEKDVQSVDKVISGRQPQMIIMASMEGGQETKTTLGNLGNGNYRPYWKETDEIAIYDLSGCDYGRFTLQSGAGTDEATFIGLGSGVDLVGLYPYSSNTNDGLRNQVLTLELPSVQKYAQDSFGDGAYPMLAVGRSSGLVFKNLCAILKLSITGTDSIEAIRFISHDSEMPVSGRATARIDYETVPELIMRADGSPDVTLQCGGVSLNPDVPTDFFIVIPPGTYKGGFELEIMTESGKMIRSTDNDVSFMRSQYRSVPAFTFVPDKVPLAVPEIVDLGLSVKWASFNLGANAPEEFGDYYAWGETEPYYSSLDPLVWKPGKEAGYDNQSYKWCQGDTFALTKYCSDPNYGYNGFTDGKKTLDLEDDAAFVNLGDKWHIPTRDEQNELLYQCSWEWTTREGIGGYLVTGPSGNSIFLPAAGIRVSTIVRDIGTEGIYMSATQHPRSSYTILGFHFVPDSTSTIGGSPLYGYSIRPVFGDIVSVESVAVYEKEVELSVGETITLTALVTPRLARDKSIIWSSSNDSVARVSLCGEVTAVSAGVSTITLTTLDGGKTATCNVTVKEASSYAVPEVIDLGLSVKWASFNLGATKPEGTGDYFAWGETEPYYYSLDPLVWKPGKEGYIWSSYKWCQGSMRTMTKYCTNPEYGYNGFTDGKSILELEDDAAYVNLGDNWRIPTIDEIEELRNNCTWESTSMNGVNGSLITGPNGNSIFLPTVGFWSNTELRYGGSCGVYWTSSGFTDSCNALCLFFDSFSRWYDYYRASGLSVRPVYDDSEPKPENKAPEPVDLGLPSGLKWASFNLGATKPEEYGDYFAWGETEPKADYSWATYKWCMGSKNTLTKYCTRSEYGYNGFTDEKTVLDPEDDAAHVILGGNWRMPTKEEQDELRNKCSWEWTQVNGVNGQMVTGPNGNSIFLPAACDPSLVYPEYVDSYGGYWSCSLYTSDPDFESYQILFFPYGTGWSYNDRFVGFSVRPVSE